MRWGRLWRRRPPESELDDEVEAYYEILIERARARGLSREQARREVWKKFESPAQVKSRIREAHVGSFFETTLRDVRYAARILTRSPGFTLFTVMTIALALGANAAIFSLVDGVLLKPNRLPRTGAHRQLWEKPPRGLRNNIAPANYLDWTKQSRSFESMAAQTGAGLSYTGGGEPKSLRAGVVSAPYFEVFGIKAAMGRTFATDEDQPGKDKVAVISHRTWTNLFGGDPGLIGRAIHTERRALHRDRRAPAGQRIRPQAQRPLGSAGISRQSGPRLSQLWSRRAPETRSVARAGAG